MVVPETEMISHGGEVESPSQDNQHEKSYTMPSIGRQSSIYSLTLDEFQHTLCEGGKNFGSMNMDEFLTSIWNAEENQTTAAFNSDINVNSGAANLSVAEAEKWIVRQPSLPRQGSLSLPAPLCSKTVDEVWSEIRTEKQEDTVIDDGQNVQNSEAAHQQTTFGEMTLEDFLIKAGVVREQCTVLEPPPPPPPPPQQQQYGMYQTMGGSGATFQSMNQSNVAIGEASGYAGNSKNGGYRPAPASGYGGGGGHYRPAQPIGVAAPVSPGSSDGMGTRKVEKSGGQLGSEIGRNRGKKRIIDGPVERVVERRQRRMIKNRESAARSRARKQAYTVELEAELNQLKDENAQLRQALNELERKRRQEYFEEFKRKAQTKAQKHKEKMRVLRKTLSCSL